MNDRILELAQQVRGGNLQALARALSLVENNDPSSTDLLSELYIHSTRSKLIGITGAPGAGKSTLADRLIQHYRNEGLSVAILAVDPSSPFTGGAILGDRVRMQRHYADPGVFIRSMASRGTLGGLAPSVKEFLTVTEASGRDIILIETAGVGQSEVDVVQLAGTVMVILTPSSGDDIQVAKAGIMEIADLFVINKADLPGSDRLEAQLEAMLTLLPADVSRPPILRTESLNNKGIKELASALQKITPRPADASYWKQRLHEQLSRNVMEALSKGHSLSAMMEDAAVKIAGGTLNPYMYIRQMLGQVQEKFK